jgi:hypothetical protein
MLQIARKALVELTHVSLICADVGEIVLEPSHSHVDIGLCTYNTLGTTTEYERFLRGAIRAMNGGVLLLSLFAGERFSELAREVYSHWQRYVGPARCNTYDDENRVFRNAETGFVSRWLSWDDIEPVLCEFQVEKQLAGLGHFVAVRL